MADEGASPPQVNVSHILTHIEYLSDAIKTEFDLIGLRMSWLVLSESFIFSAFAISVSNYRRVNGQFEILLPDVLSLLIALLPTLGVILSALVCVAIFAAHSAVYDLKGQRERLILQLSQVPEFSQMELISRTSLRHRLGNTPPWIIPPLLLIAWGKVLFFLVEHGFPLRSILFPWLGC